MMVSAGNRNAYKPFFQCGMGAAASKLGGKASLKKHTAKFSVFGKMGLVTPSGDHQWQKKMRKKNWKKFNYEMTMKDRIGNRNAYKRLVFNVRNISTAIV